jgi:Flp pilus assembly pilin Flp
MSLTLSELFLRLIALARRRDGQTMAEYGILVALIAIVVVAAAVLLGGSVSTLYSSSAHGI